jgi:thiol-disulfide isomerase/thioredoxin
MREWIVATAFAALVACAPAAPPLSPGVLDAPALGDRWLVVNYWAIWCAPCREEIPELNLLALRGLVDVYAVNFDEVQGDALLAQAAELDIQFPLLASDPGTRLGIARPTVLPTTLILTPEGALATRLIGPQTLESLEREIAAVVNQSRQG